MKLGISITGGGALGIGPLQFMRRLEADLGKKLASSHRPCKRDDRRNTLQPVQG